MFYRKYYEGTVASYSTKITKTIAGKSRTIYTNQTDVIGEALKDTLQDCGLEVTYVDYMLTVEGLQICILYTGTNTYYGYTKCGKQFIYGQSGTGWQPFDNYGSYKFYITIKGDPRGAFQIHIGTYSNPADIGRYFIIYNAKYFKNGARAFIVSDSSGSAYPIDENNNIFNDFTGNFTTPISLGSVPKVFSEDLNYYPLIPASFYGVFIIDNCYMVDTNLTEDTFYSINGEIYYCAKGKRFLVKCITDIKK